MSLSLLWSSMQLGFRCVRGQKIFFLWLPMYWAYLNLKVCAIWMFVTLFDYLSKMHIVPHSPVLLDF